MKLLRATLLGLALVAPAMCFAQWQWIDKGGRKVYSDQSPPADVPAQNILARPGMRGAPAAQAAESAASQPAQAPASAPRLSGKDKDLEEKKRRLQAAEDEKKKEREEELAKLRNENCARAKRAKVNFDSGTRVAVTNDKGERAFMDDTARAAETRRLERIIASDCKAAGG
jgi:hypothetical protein